jgi:chemotaxis-related protein WspB
MLLIQCHCGENRYAIDSRHVSAVLPRANLHRLAGTPPWLAGVLVYRGKAIPVMDLTQLTEGVPCAGRLSSRIILLETKLRENVRQFGVMAERVGLHEIGTQPGEPAGGAGEPAAFGSLHLDAHGVFQLVDVQRLISEDRQPVLFPTADGER